ncbi:MAG: hypothetical protein ILA52_00685 [Alphaproteobacteria bacterium]|nr:hypothetical protein [Alphaproteobacteria bacterium]
MSTFIKMFCVALMTLGLNACASRNNNEAVPERYSELHFDNKAPIKLNVKTIEVKSEFTPSFTRPNVEHLFPVSIEKTAKTWARERLEAVDFASNRTAEFVIQDASVTEREEKAAQLFQKDSLRYHATLKVMMKVVENKASANTTVEAYRELTMPIDTAIEDKEAHWNEMLNNLFQAFDEHMDSNIHKYLNMYIKDDRSITQY